MTALPTALVLDEHLLGVRPGLAARGILTRSVDDFNARSTGDPDVIRAIASKLRRAPWVLVTMDGTIVKEHPGFDWDRYAIAWVLIDRRVRGLQVEQAKNDVIQRHAHQMLEQRPGDHHTYTAEKHFKHPPSLVSQSRHFRPLG